MDQTTLQALYWQSQLLHDKLFSLEHIIRKISAQGKTPQKALSKYLETIDDLRETSAEMILTEAE